MTVEHSAYGTVFIGKGVDLFRWASIKAQLKLEQKGIKSSGGPLRPRLAAQMGLQPRASHDIYIAVASTYVKALRIAEGLEAPTAHILASDVDEFPKPADLYAVVRDRMAEDQP